MLGWSHLLQASGNRLRRKLRKSVEGIGETHANQFVEQTKPLDNEEFIDVGDRKWSAISACEHFI